MTGGGWGGGRKRGGEEKKERKLRKIGLQPCACCHLEVGKGLKEKEEDGVRTSQGRSADQAEKKREKKKRNRAIHLRYENKRMLFVCVMA